MSVSVKAATTIGTMITADKWYEIIREGEGGQYVIMTDGAGIRGVHKDYFDPERRTSRDPQSWDYVVIIPNETPRMFRDRQTAERIALECAPATVYKAVATTKKTPSIEAIVIN